MAIERFSDRYRQFEADLQERGARLVFWKQRDAGKAEEAINMRILMPDGSRKVVLVRVQRRPEGELYEQAMKAVFG